MKILQVNCVYKKGSTGKIVYDIHNVLKEKGIESVICYGRGKKVTETNVYKTSNEFFAKFNNLKSRFTGLQYNGCFFATNKLIRIIKREKPDVVHLHCINGFFVNIYKLIEFLKKSNIKTIVTLHAEFMYTGSCGHAYDCEKWKTGCGNCPMLKEAAHSYFIDRTHQSWLKMKKAFDGFDDNLIVTSVSSWIEKRAEESVILKNKKHSTVLNGIDTSSIFKPRTFAQIKLKHKLNNEKIILHVTANFTSENKGGKYVIQLAEILKNENIKIIVIGNIAHNMILPNNIIDVGRIYNQHELAKYYSMADLTVLTSKKETFSMVCAESLCCGTPVIGFQAGAPEQIALKEYTEFVEYGNIERLIKCIFGWIDKKPDFMNQMTEKASIYYSKERMCKGYLDLYNLI